MVLMLPVIMLHTTVELVCMILYISSTSQSFFLCLALCLTLLSLSLSGSHHEAASWDDPLALLPHEDIVAQPSNLTGQPAQWGHRVHTVPATSRVSLDNEVIEYIQFHPPPRWACTMSTVTATSHAGLPAQWGYRVHLMFSFSNLTGDPAQRGYILHTVPTISQICLRTKPKV